MILVGMVTLHVKTGSDLDLILFSGVVLFVATRTCVMFSGIILVMNSSLYYFFRVLAKRSSFAYCQGISPNPGYAFTDPRGYQGRAPLGV